MVKGEYNDRDLKLVDAALAWAHATYTVDDDRVYATGFSNGAMFTYLLWAERGDIFAAFAPSAAAASRTRQHLAPKPVLHIAGENDPLVKFAWPKQLDDLEAQAEKTKEDAK